MIDLFEAAWEIHLFLTAHQVPYVFKWLMATACLPSLAFSAALCRHPAAARRCRKNRATVSILQQQIRYRPSASWGITIPRTLCYVKHPARLRNRGYNWTFSHNGNSWSPIKAR